MGAAYCACGGPILSKMGVSIFRTPRSIFRIFVLFLVTKFLFLELLPTGPVSRFLGVRDHLLQRLMHSRGPFPARVALFGDSNFSAWLFLATNVTIFSKNLIFHISELVAPGEVPDGSSTILGHGRRNRGVRSHYICTSGHR